MRCDSETISVSPYRWLIVAGKAPGSAEPPSEAPVGVVSASVPPHEARAGTVRVDSTTSARRESFTAVPPGTIAGGWSDGPHPTNQGRSEERRVGKEGRSRWSREH